jgi:hypothetical protein
MTTSAVLHASAIEFVLDYVEEATMQPLDQSQGLEIVRTDVLDGPFACGRFHRLHDVQHDTFPVAYRCFDGEALFPRSTGRLRRSV